MSTIEARPELGINAKARYLYAKRLFETADASDKPNSQVLIDMHKNWLSTALGAIGIDAQAQNLYVLFRDGEVPERKDIQQFRKIEAQAKTTTLNILQALLWYEAPELASWQKTKLTLRSSTIFVDQAAIDDHMNNRKRDKGWLIDDYNSYPMEKYKSLIVGYYPPKQETPLSSFTFEVNEHFPGATGSLDYSDSKRKHVGVKATYNPQKQLFEVLFENAVDFVGWAQIEGEEPVYRLDYVRSMVRDLYANIRKDQAGFVQIAKWRAY